MLCIFRCFQIRCDSSGSSLCCFGPSCLTIQLFLRCIICVSDGKLLVYDRRPHANVYTPEPTAQAAFLCSLTVTDRPCTVSPRTSRLSCSEPDPTGDHVSYPGALGEPVFANAAQRAWTSLTRTRCWRVRLIDVGWKRARMSSLGAKTPTLISRNLGPDLLGQVPVATHSCVALLAVYGTVLFEYEMPRSN